MKRELLTSAFCRIRQRLRARAESIVADGDTADDIVQEAFCRVWSGNSVVERDSQAEAVLSTAVRNLSIDTVRRTSLGREVPLSDNLDITDSHDRDTQFMELYEKVDAILRNALSERDREVLLRRDRDGWEFSEIAETYGITEANARIIVSRGRKAVRTIYLTQTRNGH